MDLIDIQYFTCFSPDKTDRGYLLNLLILTRFHSTGKIGKRFEEVIIGIRQRHIDLGPPGKVAHAVLQEEAALSAGLGEVLGRGEGAEDALGRPQKRVVRIVGIRVQGFPQSQEAQ